MPERVRQALDTLAEGLLVLDESAEIVLANKSFADTVDIPVDQLVQSTADDLPWATEENEILASLDALTGCLNRRAFFERFGSFWQQSHREGVPLSCIMFDNDHFKRVNDTYGHGVGDEVLRKVAAVLRTHHAKDGLVCRYGGEEFCVLLPGVEFEAAIE